EIYIGSSGQLIFKDDNDSNVVVSAAAYSTGPNLAAGEICIDGDNGRLIWCRTAGAELQALWGYRTFGSTTEVYGSIWIADVGGVYELRYAFYGAIWAV